MISKPKEDENRIKINQQPGVLIESANALQSVSAELHSSVDSPVLESSDQPLLCKQTKQGKDDKLDVSLTLYHSTANQFLINASSERLKKEPGNEMICLVHS